MNIIFQDIDGPLIPARLYFFGGRPTLEGAFFWDPVAVMMINKLCEMCDAKIVFNTAHNENPAEVMRHQAAMNRLGHIHDDCQTEYPKQSSRFKAIENWLEKHPEVKGWVVIDDMPVHNTNQVKVDFDIGMTLNNFNQAVEILTGIKPSSIISGIGVPLDVALEKK